MKKDYGQIANSMQDESNPFMVGKKRVTEAELTEKEKEAFEYNNFIKYENVMPSGWL